MLRKYTIILTTNNVFAEYFIIILHFSNKIKQNRHFFRFVFSEFITFDYNPYLCTTLAQRNMRDRNIDIYRGCVMMYMTCFIHLIFWMKFLEYPYKSWLIIGSPASFIVAGAAFSLSSPKKYLVYAKKRAYRVIRPYWLYASIILILLTALHFILGADSLPDWKGIAKWFLFTPESKYPLITDHLWYIMPYIIISLCGPFLYQWWNRLKYRPGF